MMNDSCNKENLEVHNVVKSDLNLPEGKSKNDTMVIIIPDGINNVVIEKKWQEHCYFSMNYGLQVIIAKIFSGIYCSFMEYNK